MVAETPARAPLPQPGCQSHSSECLLGVGEGGLCPLPRAFCLPWASHVITHRTADFKIMSPGSTKTNGFPPAGRSPCYLQPLPGLVLDCC